MAELYGGASPRLLKFRGAPPTSQIIDLQHPAGGLHEPDPTVNKPPTPIGPAPQDAAAAQLDADALARLRELDPDGRHGVVERVLKAFEASLVRMLGQLAAQRDGGDGGDAAVVASVAHTLKSSSASVGALALARTCAEVECRLRTDGPVSLGGDIERLLHDGEAALVVVKAMLRR